MQEVAHLNPNDCVLLLGTLGDPGTFFFSLKGMMPFIKDEEVLIAAKGEKKNQCCAEGIRHQGEQ